MADKKARRDAGSSAEEAHRNPSLIPELLATLGSKSTARFKAAKELSLIAKDAPDLLYPHFDTFAALLDSPSSVLLWNGLIILGQLSTVDSERRFDTIFDRYFSHLWDGKLVTAANVVSGSGAIARARPEMADRVITEILNIDQISLPTDECHEVIRGEALLAFGDCIEVAKGDARVTEFTRRCLESTRPATRKKAEDLLNRLGI